MKILFLLILSTMLSFSRTPEEQAEWFSERWAAIEEAQQNPTPELIRRLGTILSANGQNIERRGPKTQELFRAAQATLLSIPGHAEFYSERLDEIYKESLSDAKRHNRSYLNFSHERGFIFGTFIHMPSPETVRVLGEMLDDMRSCDLRNTNPRDWTIDSWPSSPYGWSAAQILTKMELSGAPMKQFIFVSEEEQNKMTAEEYYNVNIEPWRLWYAQVKAGTRTFRFKGSDVEYNLDGPVRTGAGTPSLRKNVDQAAGLAETDRTSPWPLIGSLLVLAAAGGWYFFRGRSPGVRP